MDCSNATFAVIQSPNFRPPYFEGLITYTWIMFLLLGLCGGTVAIADNSDLDFKNSNTQEFLCKGSIIFFLLSFMMFSFATQSIAIADNFNVIPNVTICSLKFIDNGYEPTSKKFYFYGKTFVIAEIDKQNKALEIGNCIQKWKAEPSKQYQNSLVETDNKLTFFTRVSPEDESVQEYCWYEGNKDTWYLDVHGYNLIITCFVFLAFSVVSGIAFCCSFYTE